MATRRQISTNGKDANKPPAMTNGTTKVIHEHEENSDHAHSHSHSLFSGHSHSHGGDEDHSQGAEQIIAALKGSGDRGSQITLIGLFSNVGLTLVKGTAGWYMHSASLLAEAGHSASDLLGDFVTLICWNLSRKPPSTRYPYGFAKFETFGTTTVSLLLVGGALGIGFHSYHLLVEALNQTAATMHPGPLHDVVQNVTIAAQHVPVFSHSHVDAQLDPNAAWFAAISIVAKEWLYRATKKVADDEKSPVLWANALHHRSDAYSSAVALVAILGSWFWPALPLDPIGGILVSFVILQQGWSVFASSFRDMTDAGVSPKTQQTLIRTLAPLLPSTIPSAELASSIAAHPAPSPSPSQIENNTQSLLAIRHLRAKRAGSIMFVDLTADVSKTLSVGETSALEEKITQTLKAAKREIGEVRVRFHPVDEDENVSAR